MRSMQVKAFLDVSSVEISFAPPSAGAMGFADGGRVVVRVNIHQSVDGKPYMQANPHTMALSFQGSPEILTEIKKLIEEQGLDALLGTYDADGGFNEEKKSNRDYPVGGN